MRAAQVFEYGGSENLKIGEASMPEPGNGEVRVKLSHAGINFIDVYVRQGVYKHLKTYANTPPFTIGMEGGGVVDALGDGVDGMAVGDRVAWCLELGSYAEYAVVPAWKCIPIPDDIDMDIGVTLMLQGSTAHYLASSLYPLKPGDSCLVHAGAGGVGQLLCQIARLRGARVLTTVSTEEKAEIVRAFGAEPILYKNVDFADAVLDMTDGDGVHAVYDGIGKDTFQGSLKACRRRGTIGLFGGASGQVQSIDPLELAEAGSVFVTRPHLANYIHDQAERRSRADDLFAWVRSGDLKVTIDKTYPLAEAGAAHDYLEAGKTKGKLILEI